ncbi:MAG: hypothetical protein WBR24_01545 [Desulfobacterales bacterium]|jgi:hypothetical protein
MNERHRRLVGKIEELLRAGIEVGPDLLGYIDATFSNPSVKELEGIVADESDPEREGLLELIFFPDEPMQQKLEELLPEAGGLGQGDVDAVAAELSARRIHTALVFSDWRDRLAVDFPPALVTTFLQRLNLTRRIEPRLAMAISTHVAPVDRIAVRVKLRNIRKHMSDGKVLFLCDFLSKLGGDDQLLACLEFTLNFLEDIEDDADVYAVLMNRRRIGWQLLQKSAQFEEKLKKDNIETLMLRGERAPHVSKEELLKTIAFIERISLAVFGRLDPLDFDLLESADFAFRSHADLGEIIRRMI